MSSNEPTYARIANDWNLWAEYVDPAATMTEAGFDALTISEKVAIQTDCFGAEVYPECEHALETDAQKCPTCEAAEDFLYGPPLRNCEEVWDGEVQVN